MKPQTKADAEKRLCPFTFGGNRPADKCCTSYCMAWRVVHHEHRLEGQSGAREYLISEGIKTERIARCEGDPMSSGFWVLDEVGVCARISG